MCVRLSMFSFMFNFKAHTNGVPFRKALGEILFNLQVVKTDLPLATEMPLYYFCVYRRHHHKCLNKLQLNV